MAEFIKKLAVKETILGFFFKLNSFLQNIAFGFITLGTKRKSLSNYKRGIIGLNTNNPLYTVLV